MAVVEPEVTRMRIPMEMRARLSDPKYLQNVCGYCATGSHDNCKRAIRAGDGHIMLCPCTEHATLAGAEVKCTECYNTDIDELDEKLWLCIDRTDCESRIRERLGKDPSYALIHQAYANASVRLEREAKERPARSKSPSRPSSGKCACCGETTGGGLFRPGHDARLVSQTAADVAAGKLSPVDAVAKFEGLGTSPALIAKLTRKLERQ